jgi:hypothetical protein
MIQPLPQSTNKHGECYIFPSSPGNIYLYYGQWQGPLPGDDFDVLVVETTGSMGQLQMMLGRGAGTVTLSLEAVGVIPGLTVSRG